MTPKEKAQELFDKMVSNIEGYGWKEMAIECTLIAIDEILNNFGSTADGKHFYTAYSTLEYWQEVKQEIKKL